MASDAAQAPAQHNATEALLRTLDLLARSAVAWLSGPIRPVAMAHALLDWQVHLLEAPGTCLRLQIQAGLQLAQLAGYAAHSTMGVAERPPASPDPQDHRFADPAWRQWPYDILVPAFLLQQQWWQGAAAGGPGMAAHHRELVSFWVRQWLDAWAPSNFLATNPVLQRRVGETAGMCLVDGLLLWIEDAQRLWRREPPAGSEAYRVGQDVAVSSGQVVFRNELIELIQYAPTTAQVRPEPVLIVPAWIMKYYILDLSPENSLVRWLTGQGFTVFMISWHNPTARDRNTDWDDYLAKGSLAALAAIEAITGARQVHAAGYCIGGTLLATAAAELARIGTGSLATVTLFAAQTDFSEPGEIALFIDEDQVGQLEAEMWSLGYLDSSQMAAAFQLLRANDLIWSRLLRTYLMGQRDPLIDLIAWNADGTRMPYAMHSHYLRRFFLGNELARGRFQVGGHPISLSELALPLFVVATERDHVAPWRSVYKIHEVTETEVTFVLASGGHNAGIVAPPGHNHAHYRSAKRPAGGPVADPDAWLARAEPHEESWWPAWGDWLAGHSGPPVPPPPLGAPERGYPPLDAAPGRYVLER